MPQSLDDVLAQMTAASTELDGCTVYIKSVPGLIDAAVKQVVANGATAAQLAPLTALSATLKQKADDAVAAIQANTTPPVPPAP